MSAYAGEKVKLYVSILDELGNPVSAILRLTDSQVCRSGPLKTLKILHVISLCLDEHHISIWIFG